MHKSTPAPDATTSTPEAAPTPSSPTPALKRNRDSTPEPPTNRSIRRTNHHLAANDDATTTAPAPPVDEALTPRHAAPQTDDPQVPSTAAELPGADRHRTSASNPRHRNRHPRHNQWLHYAATNRERGMSTAEYAVGTIAACAFAALLMKIVSGTEVAELLTGIISRALNTDA
ncbi:DUF4244 domain-containing protein [Nonomuraea coxensis]